MEDPQGVPMRQRHRRKQMATYIGNNRRMYKCKARKIGIKIKKTMPLPRLQRYTVTNRNSFKFPTNMT